MRLSACLALALSAAACDGHRESPPAIPAPVVETPAPPAPAKATPEQRAAAAEGRLTAFRAMKRARAYEREGQARVPALIEAALGDLRPSGVPYKTVRAEAFRGMKLLRHTPGFAQFKLRFVTTVRDGAVRAAMEAPLRAGGWLGANQTLRSPLKRSDGSVVEVTLQEPDEMPTVIDLVLTTKDLATPLETPSVLLARPPVWPTVMGDVSPVGYEFGHFHGTRAGGSYSDIERIAVAFAPKSAKALQRRVRGRLLALGFILDDDGIILRGPDRVSLALTISPKTGHLLVHHQRRWKTPGPPAPPTAAPGGPARAAPYTPPGVSPADPRR